MCGVMRMRRADVAARRAAAEAAAETAEAGQPEPAAALAGLPRRPAAARPARPPSPPRPPSDRVALQRHVLADVDLGLVVVEREHVRRGEQVAVAGLASAASATPNEGTLRPAGPPSMAGPWIPMAIPRECLGATGRLTCDGCPSGRSADASALPAP